MNSKDGWVEIRTGLAGGEWLVVRGAEALTHGRARAVDASSRRWTPRRRAPRSRRAARGARTARRRAARPAPASAAARARGRRGGREARSAAAVNITDVSIKNPVFAWMLMASTMLFGIVAITRVGISQYPDVDYPNISVSVSWPGASPSAVEREIVEPLEQSISQVEGVKSMSSKASAGNGRITVVFDMSRDVDLALQDVQARVGSATALAAEGRARRHRSSKSNPDDQAILTIARDGPVLAAGPRRRRALPGPGEAPDRRRASGRSRSPATSNRNVRIWLDASRLAEKGVVANDVINAIRTEHVEVPGGQLETGGRSLNVRLLGEALDLDAAAGSSSSSARKPAPVYLEDVADRRGRLRGRDLHRAARRRAAPGARRPQAARHQRRRRREGGARRASPRSSSTLPEGMKVEVLFDQTMFIEESVHELELELGMARRPHRARLLALPRLALEHAQRRPRDPDVAARHRRGHLLPRLHAQHLHAARPLARRRARRRRRRHGHGEHLPPRGDGEGPRDGVRRRHQGDHLRRARRDARRHRHLPARHLHAGRHREVLLPVRRDALGRRAALVPRGDHARARALRADPPRLARGPRRARARSPIAPSRGSSAATRALLGARARHP